MAQAVTPTDTNPLHHLTLSDGTTTVGLILCGPDGKRNDRAIQGYPLDPSPIHTTSGDPTYDNLSGPHRTVSQADFSGGRGMENFESDRSRYYDSLAADTTRGYLILGPQPTYASGHRNLNQNMPDATYTQYIWQKAYGAQRFMSFPFTAAANYNAKYIEVYMRRVGTPSARPVLRVYSDSGNLPNTSLTSAAVTSPYDAVSSYEIGVSYLGRAEPLGGGAIIPLTSGTKYHMVIDGGASADASNCWEICCGLLGGKKSDDGATWVGLSFGPYFRVLDDTKPFIAHFFEYKNQLYFATAPDDGAAGKLYMNGWRGACDANLTEKGALKDATQTGWDHPSLTNLIAKITGGEASVPYQNWRRIDSAESGKAYCIPPWEVAHTTADEYVVLGSNKFFEIDSTTLGSPLLTRPISSVQVVNDIIYMAQSNLGEMVMHAEYNNAGTWIAENTATEFAWMGTGAKPMLLQTTRDGYGTPVLWMSDYTTKTRISNQVVYHDEILAGYLDDTSVPWTGRGLAASDSTWTAAPNASVGGSGDMTRLYVDDAHTTGLIAYHDIGSTKDVRYHDRVVMYIKSSVALAAGDLQFVMDDTDGCVSPIITINLPAMAAGRMYELPLQYNAESTAGAEAIRSIGFSLTADKGACTITLWGGITAYKDRDPIQVCERNERITGLERYGEPETLWVLSEGGLGEIRNEIYVPIPIREMQTVRSEHNGRAHCVGDVYLYFSLGERGSVQRYYRQNLESVGLDLDAGLPGERQGPVSCLISYPGRIYASVDGGDSGYSAIYCRAGNGWHEIYRAPRPGERIRSMYIQSIPGIKSDRLWVSQGADVLWLPINLNPWADTAYRYHCEAHVVTGWVYLSLQDVQKQWKSLKLFCENLTAGAQYIQADYQLDGDTTWTAISGNFDSVPVEEINLSTATPPNVQGRRIRFRLRLYTTDAAKSPRVNVVSIQGYAITPVKYGYTLTAKISEDDLSIDYEGDEQLTLGQFARAENAWEKLLEWAGGTTALTLRSTYSVIDNKTVILKPPPLRPLKLLPEDQIEEHLVQFSFDEL
jgi:hypothetical protein